MRRLLLIAYHWIAAMYYSIQVKLGLHMLRRYLRSQGDYTRYSDEGLLIALHRICEESGRELTKQSQEMGLYEYTPNSPKVQKQLNEIIDGYQSKQNTKSHVGTMEPEIQAELDKILKDFPTSSPSSSPS